MDAPLLNNVTPFLESTNLARAPVSRVGLRRLHLRHEGNVVLGDPDRIGSRLHEVGKQRPNSHGVAPGGNGEGNQVEPSTARRPTGLQGPQAPIACSPAKKVAPGGRRRRFQIETGPPAPPDSWATVHCSTIDRARLGGADPARARSCADLLCAGSASAETWRGLSVTPEHRCSPYRAADYSYPQSMETRW